MSKEEVSEIWGEGADIQVEVLVLNRSDMLGLVSWNDVIDLEDMTYKACGMGQVVQPQKEFSFIDPPDNLNFFVAMPGFIKTINVAGIKYGSDFANRAPGQPLGYALVLLCDPKETGKPFALLDGGLITVLRTAGHSAIAAKYLAKKNSQTIALIGCGLEAIPHLAAFNELFPLKVAKVYDIKPEAVAKFKQDAESLPLEIISTKSAKEAVEEADIVCIITTAQKPVVLEPWISPGCFVSGLMGFLDLDPMLSKKADKWVLGDMSSDGHHLIDLRGDGKVPMELSRDDVYGDMGEIVTGAKPGRENEQERIVYTHIGMGAHDLMLANEIYKRAKERGIGTRIRVI
ncbi:MAG: ornithine cyclodeaminase family protein [Dehalococcoidia bacterium]|nr:MAG: ornithine cyclodeaminase family protein [Dehalococcoidia bacterium]